MFPYYIHISQWCKLSNVIYSTALQAQYLPHKGELSALIKQNHYHRRVEGCSRSVIQDCGCDRKGRKLSWEARAEEVGFEVLPKRCNRGTISYMEREGVLKGRGIVTEGVKKVFN